MEESKEERWKPREQLSECILPMASVLNSTEPSSILPAATPEHLSADENGRPIENVGGHIHSRGAVSDGTRRRCRDRPLPGECSGGLLQHQLLLPGETRPELRRVVVVSLALEEGVRALVELDGLLAVPASSQMLSPSMA